MGLITHILPSYATVEICCSIFITFCRFCSLIYGRRGVKVGGASESGSSAESFYPLYDNGRSLFYEDTEETAARAVADVALYSTGFGPVGTYYDCVMDIAASGIQFSKLMDLDIDESEVADILESSRFKGYRLEYGCKWIMKTIEILKSI